MPLPNICRICRICRKNKAKINCPINQEKTSCPIIIFPEKISKALPVILLVYPETKVLLQKCNNMSTLIDLLMSLKGRLPVTKVFLKETKKTIKRLNKFIENCEKSKQEYEDPRKQKRLSSIAYNFPGRLFPLSLDTYNNWAYQIWTKKGKPGFKKQRITGVLIGKGYVTTNGKTGWAKKIYRRYLGVLIERTPKNHVTIKITCPD
jgi:hypothetical protein